VEREQTVQDVLQATCRELVERLDARACAISRIVGDLLIGLVEFAHGRGPLAIGHEYLISDYPLTLEAVTEGEPRTVSLLDEAPEPTEAELLRKMGYESLLMLCLVTYGECWGLVEVYADERRFGEQDANLAAQIVGRAAQRLEQLDP
jgi:GAF domain-containing protein